MIPHLRQARLPDGLHLAYAEHGDPAGPPVVMLHGVGESWRGFAAVMAHLPPGLRAIAVSLRGHGESDRPATGYGMDALVADVAAFLDALDLPRPLLVGHCLGGGAALRLALARPDRLGGLVLMATQPDWRDHPDAAALWDDVIATLTDPVDPGFLRAYIARQTVRPLPEALAAMLLAEARKLPAHAWRGLVREALRDAPPPQGPVVPPTLVLHGDRDDLTAAGQPALHRLVGAPRVETIAEAGHCLHWEVPALCAALIGGFAREVFGADKPR